MDSFEVNKILGAVLGTLTFTLALSIGAQMVFETKAPAKPGFALAGGEAAGGGGAPEAPQVASIATRLAQANSTKGESLAKQCAACHNFAEGQGAEVGPDLYGVVGREIAHQAGFNYTPAIKKLAAAKKTWTFDNLDLWLTNPPADAPGTAMTFAGISNPQQRADLIDYLNKNSAKPEPLPKPEPEAAKPAAAPAAKGAAAAPAKADFATLVAAADPTRGESVAKICAACHNFAEGQGPKVGPDLYGVVGRPIAAQKGFSYSAALKKLAQSKGKWTVDELNDWITNPQTYAPGTAMTFSGIKSEKQRADLVAYLNKNSAHPEPLKAESGNQASGGAAPAATTPAADGK